LQIYFGTRLFNAQGLFFDKDGTLVDFHHQYASLMGKRTDLILSHWRENADSLRKALGRAVGYDLKTGMISPTGPLAVKTRKETIEICAAVLSQHGMPWEEAYGLTFWAFQQADKDLTMEELIEPSEGLVSLLTLLKERGVLLACLTNDDIRRATDVLAYLGISGCFDLVMGADDVLYPKPHPEIFEKACQRLGLLPKQTAYIGDTVSDMVMAKKGGAGLAVGILGGASDRSLLSQEADVVVENLKSITVLD